MFTARVGAGKAGLSEVSKNGSAGGRGRIEGGVSGEGIDSEDSGVGKAGGRAGGRAGDSNFCTNG